jgi:hypothetical protein
MASARLQITVESACNLYNSDGVWAGKSDPYVIVEVPGQENMKLQTEVVSNELNPVWNFSGEIAGFMDGDVLRFTVMDKDTFPKPDDFLGRAELTAQDFYPNGFHGELSLADSKTQATLSVIIVVIGYDGAAPELVEGEDVQTTVPGEFVEGTVVAGSSSAAVHSTHAGNDSTMLGNSSTDLYSGTPAGCFSSDGLAVSSTGPTTLDSGMFTHGLPVYSPGVFTTTAPTSESLTYSATQTDSAPQDPMNDTATTSVVGTQSMASQSTTYSAPQASLPTGKVVVHPPRTVTAEEFAKINGYIVGEPLPVTVGIDTVGVETNQDVVVNDTDAVDKKVKIKKKKSKRCC